MKFLSRKLLAFTLVATLLTGCDSSSAVENNTVATTNTATTATTPVASDVKVEKMSIVTTTFAEYDWVREILGENVGNFNLTLLLDNGLDLHSFNPSVDDIINIGNADLFIYNGGESTVGWAGDVISQAKNDNLAAVNLLEELGDLAQMAEHVHTDECTDVDCEIDHSAEEHDHAHDEEECTDPDCDHDHSHDEEEHDHAHDEEECVEDCCLVDEEDHDHDHDEEECTDPDCEIDHSAEEHSHDHDDCCDVTEDGHSHDHEDEHYWMSLNNAKLLCSSIADKIIAIDPSNADVYNANLTAYIAKLDALDAEYQATVSSANRNVLVVADRFPFIYLTSDYGLEYYAAFSGCTAETEASFETIMFLTEKVNEYDLTCVVTTETGHEISNTIVSSTKSKDQEIFVLDSIQSTNSSSGETYLGIMEENLKVLAKILD